MFERGGLIALVALVAYVWIAPTTVVGGDNAEFATLGTLGGVAHPSGYPLYLLWLRATTWLPAASPAHATAIATCILAALQILVLHAACRAWGARPFAATIAVAIYAAGPVVLQIHTEAEVFALNSLIVSVVLWLAARNGPLRGTWRVVVLALVAGLGLANHSTCVVVAPVGLLGAIRGVREAERPPYQSIAMAVGALALGLTPYLYLLVTAETALSWTRIDGLGGIVHHFLRLDYGGSGQLASDGVEVDYIAQLGAFARDVGAVWLWLPALVGIAAFGWFIVRPHDGREPRTGWSTLAASFALAGPVLLARFNLDPHDIGAFVVSRFHILPSIVLAIPIAVAINGLLDRAPKLGARLALASVVAAFAFLALTARSLPRLSRSQSPALQLAVESSFKVLPPRAVVIVTPESLYFASGYVQGVLHQRPDIDVLSWPMMKSPEYRERIHRRTGLTVEAPAGGHLSDSIADQVLGQGRPLFVDAYGASFARAFPTYPFGILFRVLPKGAKPPSPGEVFELNKAMLANWKLDYPLPTADDQPAAEVQDLYVRWWMLIAQQLAATHDPREALAREIAARLAPQ